MGLREQLKINYAKCKACEGTGKYNHWWSGKEKPCPACKGKGEVKVEERKY